MTDYEATKRFLPAFHYTGISSLPKIFPGKGIVRFRLTDVRFQNDPTESLLLGALIETEKTKLLAHYSADDAIIAEKILSPTLGEYDKKIFMQFNQKFIGCFSYNRDSLIFWNQEYAGLDGFCIAFKGKELVDHAKDNELSFEKVQYVDLGKVSEEQLSILAKNLMEYVDLCKTVHSKNTDLELNQIAYIANSMFLDDHSCFYKHNCWSHENEVRLVKVTKSEKMPGMSVGEYFNNSIGKDMAKYSPCVDVELIGKKLIPVSYIELNESMVGSIMVGPEVKVRDIEVIKNYLLKNDYKQIGILKSKASVRKRELI